MEIEKLSSEEQIEYLEKFYNRLLEHRYRYYILDAPVLEDWIYDYLEKEYNKMASEAGIKLMEMVDFDAKNILALEAKDRVDNNMDSHSLWEKEMLPIWEKLGRPKKYKENNGQ